MQCKQETRRPRDCRVTTDVEEVHTRTGLTSEILCHKLPGTEILCCDGAPSTSSALRERDHTLGNNRTVIRKKADVAKPWKNPLFPDILTPNLFILIFGQGKAGSQKRCHPLKLRFPPRRPGVCQVAKHNSNCFMAEAFSMSRGITPRYCNGIWAIEWPTDLADHEGH